MPARKEVNTEKMESKVVIKAKTNLQSNSSVKMLFISNLRKANAVFRRYHNAHKIFIKQ